MTATTVLHLMAPFDEESVPALECLFAEVLATADDVVLDIAHDPAHGRPGAGDATGIHAVRRLVEALRRRGRRVEVRGAQGALAALLSAQAASPAR